MVRTTTSTVTANAGNCDGSYSAGTPGSLVLVSTTLTIRAAHSLWQKRVSELSGTRRESRGCESGSFRGAVRALLRLGLRLPRAPGRPRPGARSRIGDIHARVLGPEALRPRAWRGSAVAVRDREQPPA